MKFHRDLLCMATLLLVVFACNRDNEYLASEEEKIIEEGMLIEGNLNGRVINEDLSPVDLATVEVNGETATTD